ncbi:DDB1- and CUL4-associated factor 17 isoform X1 [Chrysemys picta bellii]|uniref:DDB1 and CUL4 associated factor 17 n=2 Tax=Emydidae TaxID=8476 RepID=A0A8C3FDB6_CHRPI|nr:DDB1- and CUL4-associated factor 17 isoform X1 [Chrysemys picta bellii]XP_005290501.1 DDB1- and CUL4-associated factor 17 isoform X1 [Chrysemys picta bellii]XP_023970617.1 DDB1- and CUL4-associated factor 17 isoform X1 [Chrysemys picta bellii]
MSPDSAASSSSATRLSSSALKIHNVCRLLTRRSHGFYTKDAGVAHRKNMGILRKLVCQKSTKFKNVWTTHSTSPIAYERGRIYFDNYRCCVSSIAREPRILYQLPACSKSEKIEDALLLECPLGETLPSPPDYKSSLAVLTAHNWLLRLSANTGEILEKIYLPPYCKFRYLSWDTPQEIMVVKSAQHKLPAAAQQAGIQQSVLFFLAVFRVLPLKFIGMLEINKKIFGNNVTDVALSHGMLIVMYSMGLVRLYSFQSLSEQFTEQQFDLGCKCNWNGKVGIVGKYPFGLPCNIKITDTPPLLFEVSSLENSFQIGGYPWHYIITPNKKKHKGVFHICALKDNALAKNGIQDMKCCSLEPDWIYFHPDTSGRIIHVGPNLIKILKLKEIENNKYQQEIAEDFVIVANRQNNANNSVTVTASGRVVKKRFNLLDDDPEQETFKIVDYEDELDLLSVVAVTQIGADGKAHLDFHCNEHGILLKSIPLVESWDVTYNHEVYFDRDIVLHIEQKPNRIFICYLYQMVCDSAEEDEHSSLEKVERVFCKKGERIFECF